MMLYQVLYQIDDSESISDDRVSPCMNGIYPADMDSMDKVWYNEMNASPRSKAELGWKVFGEPRNASQQKIWRFI